MNYDILSNEQHPGVSIKIKETLTEPLLLMKWTFDHAGLPAYVRVSVDGNATAEDSRALWQELIALPEWKPGTSVLIDNRSLEPMGFKNAEMVREVADLFVEKKDEIGASCIAVVRKEPERYSYSRQFEYSIRLRGSPVIVRNFFDEAAAIEWLKNSEGICGANRTTLSHSVSN